MKSLFAGSILVLMFCVGSFAQTNQTAPCPTISVSGPSGVVLPGEVATFVVTVSEVAKNFQVKYEWTVSDGKIIEGQGTSIIKVLQENIGNNLTASVEVKGLPNDCDRIVSETAAPYDPPENVEIDEYSISVNQIDKPKLDSLAKYSENNSSAQIYIIERFQNNTSPKSIERKNQKIVDYLKTQGIERERITLLNAFDKENLTKFILVPAGGQPPYCDDCITVDPK